MTAVIAGGIIAATSCREKLSGKAAYNIVRTAVAFDVLVLITSVTMGILGTLSIVPLTGIASGALIGLGAGLAFISILELMVINIVPKEQLSELKKAKTLADLNI